MALWRLQVTIPMDSALTADYASNTWHFVSDDTEAATDDVADALDAFYDDIAGQLSSLITPGAWVYKFFDLADPEPRVPRYTKTDRGPATTGSNSAPPEVALCLSFRGNYGSGVPAARARNRLYIGPLQAGSIGADGRPSSGLVTALADAGDALLTASGAGAWDWVGYSPTDAGQFGIVQGWVDNEFDTQRRRGRQATSRSVFP